MAVLNKKVSLATAIKIIINRRCRTHNYEKIAPRRFSINSVLKQRSEKGYFHNLLEDM